MTRGRISKSGQGGFVRVTRGDWLEWSGGRIGKSGQGEDW